MSQSERAQRIREKLQTGLAATSVEVEDESHLHIGHEGAKGGKGHFRVTVVAECFRGRSRVQAQRMVFDLLADEMQNEIHALSVQVRTPENS